jgi:cell division septum initiation protein DivIVA
MLQAKQRALQEQVSQLKRELQDLPESSDGGKGKGRAQAQEHLSEAGARMKDFQNEMAEARYRAKMDEQRSNGAVALMDSAKRELDLAKEALDGELTLSNEQKLAKKAQEMAEQLAEDADALADSVTSVEREQMQARLEAAKRLLEMMPEPQWATVDRAVGTQSGASLVLTKNPNLVSAETARQMARQFWSIAIDAKKRGSQWIDDEPSDVEFYGQENEFFENAARYDQEPVKK